LHQEVDNRIKFKLH
ncbi:unnamed protein product, partial [Allacma fusca]